MNTNQYDDIIKEARKIFEERQAKYGNSTDIIDIHTIIGLMLMKLSRIYNLPDTAKIEDELLDSINYCVFALNKFYNTK